MSVGLIYPIFGLTCSPAVLCLHQAFVCPRTMIINMEESDEEDAKALVVWDDEDEEARVGGPHILSFPPPATKLNFDTAFQDIDG